MYDIDFFATDLNAQAARIQGDSAWRRPVAALPAGNETASVAHANHHGAFLESGNHNQTVGTGDFLRPDAVPGFRQRVKSGHGLSEPVRCVIPGCSSQSRRYCQEENVPLLSHKPRVLPNRSKRVFLSFEENQSSVLSRHAAFQSAASMN
jgi:hypothetical protein